MYYCLIQVHEIVKSLEALRQQEARSEWTAEQKERNRELSRIRMARKRARDKEKRKKTTTKKTQRKIQVRRLQAHRNSGNTGK